MAYIIKRDKLELASRSSFHPTLSLVGRGLFTTHASYLEGYP
jgi:hypothetical protein